MVRNLIVTISVCFMILTLTSACTEQDKSAEAAPTMEQSNKATTATASVATLETPGTGEAVWIMDTPVNFSTPEDVENVMDLVRTQAGEAQASRLSNALRYILNYDPSLGRDKEKMYKKLNGRTPNEIIAKMKR